MDLWIYGSMDLWIYGSMDLWTRETGTQRTLAASTEQMLVVISIEIDECCIYNDEFCI